MTRWMTVAAVVVSGWFLAACGPGGGTDPPDTSGTTDTSDSTDTTDTSDTTAHSFTDADCTDPAYPVPLGVETDRPDEIDYLDDIVACTDEASSTVWLRNNSDAVWEVYQDGAPVAINGDSAFRTMFGSTTAFAPDEEITFASYQPYEWHVSDPLSATWVGYDLLREEFQKFGEETIAKAIDRRTAIGGAVATCALAVRDVAGVEGSDDGAQVLTSVFQAGAGGAQCRDAVGSLHYTDETGRRVTILEDLTHLRAQTQTLELVSERLGYASKAATFTRFVLHLP